jgi:hypothetical protein
MIVWYSSNCQQNVFALEFTIVDQPEDQAIMLWVELITVSISKAQSSDQTLLVKAKKLLD